MNVAFLITKSEIGGAQRFVQEQIIILKECNIQLFLVTNKQGWLTQVVQNEVNKCLHHEGIESKISLDFFLFLSNFISKNKIDLIICNSANAGFYGRLACLFNKCRSIYVSHGWSSIYNGGKLSFLLNFIEKALSIIGDSVLCISENDYELGHRKIGIKRSKLHLLCNAILPPSKFSTLPISAILRLVMVCRLDHPKRPDLLIDAVKRIGPSIELTIIGNGKQYFQLKSMVEEDVQHIIFKGEVEGFNDFDKYDAFALISLSEGLPISALEAMSAGLALILSNVGGCPSLIKENGILVENDVDSIINGLTKVKNNIEFYKSNSLKLFNSNFNLVTNAAEYISYYKSVVG